MHKDDVRVFTLADGSLFLVYDKGSRGRMNRIWTTMPEGESVAERAKRYRQLADALEEAVSERSAHEAHEDATVRDEILEKTTRAMRDVAADLKKISDVLTSGSTVEAE
jgi:hypothetical protein